MFCLWEDKTESNTIFFLLRARFHFSDDTAITCIPLLKKVSLWWHLGIVCLLYFSCFYPEVLNSSFWLDWSDRELRLSAPGSCLLLWWCNQWQKGTDILLLKMKYQNRLFMCIHNVCIQCMLCYYIVIVMLLHCNNTTNFSQTLPRFFHRWWR